MHIGKFFEFRRFALFTGHWVLNQDVNQVVRGSAFSFTSLRWILSYIRSALNHSCLQHIRSDAPGSISDNLPTRGPEFVPGIGLDCPGRCTLNRLGDPGSKVLPRIALRVILNTSSVDIA